MGPRVTNDVINIFTTNIKMCTEIGCKKRSFYGPKGGKRLRCSHHRELGDINVTIKSCEDADCYVQPSFSPTGKRGVRCLAHKLPGDISTERRSCEEKWCNTQPSFGSPGGKSKRCAKHRHETDINVSKRLCEAESCDNPATNASRGERKPLRCGGHKKKGDVNVKNRLCAVFACDTRPSFAPFGCKPLRCVSHKKEGDVDVSSLKCGVNGCLKQPSYGPRGSKPMRCVDHIWYGDICSKNRLCEYKDCEKQALCAPRGEKEARCGSHQTEGDVYIKSVRCKAAICVHTYGKFERPRATKVNPITGKKEICADCWRALHPELDGKLSVLKEHFILAELQRQLPELEDYFLTHDCRIPGQACSSKRPDMVWIVKDTLVHVEIDEWGEKHEDSLERIVGIHAASGLMYHSCIRFNPDPYEEYPACLKRTQTRSGEPVYKRNTTEWNRRIPILVENMKEVFEACVTTNGSLVAGKRKLCF